MSLRASMTYDRTNRGQRVPPRFTRHLSQTNFSACPSGLLTLGHVILPRKQQAASPSHFSHVRSKDEAQRGDEVQQRGGLR